jgi:hypothetical protein
MIGSPADQKDMLALAAEKDVKVWYEERPMKEISKAFDGVLPCVEFSLTRQTSDRASRDTDMS